ncbi:MAG: efflux RND transporter periplasmic adaptor subunit, partial [Bryobacteraceae bacterium]|nr:efflux RND transporter periplasmic adaptor subunit [Bryobacteraceae bacterium]
DGLVVEKNVEPGNLAAPGAPLLVVEQEGAYRFEAAVEESRLGTVRAGQSVRVKLDALGRELVGRVAEIVPAVDAAARSFTVKIDLPAAGGLR